MKWHNNMRPDSFLRYRHYISHLLIYLLTSGQSNLTQGHIAAARGRFSCIHQVVPMCTPSNTCFLGPTWVHIPNCISVSSAVFAQFMAESPCTLQWAGAFHVKIACSHWGQPPNMCFLWPTQVHNPNGISIGSAIFAGLKIFDRPTDHATASVTIGCIYVITSMWPSNSSPTDCLRSFSVVTFHVCLSVCQPQQCEL